MEVITAILIIAVLAAVLLPVYGGVKGKARESVDISNMRQVYMAITMYESDFDSTTPQRLDQVGHYAKSQDLFRAPRDPVKQTKTGSYPARLFVIGAPERIHYRVSYAFLRSYPGYYYLEDQWDEARQQDKLGMIASQWHGAALAGPTSPEFAEHGVPFDGPVLRITMGGSLYRLAKRKYPEVRGSINDLFLDTK